MNSKTIQIFVISAIILSSLGIVSIQNGYAFEWIKSTADMLSFRDVTDTTPTANPVISFDKSEYVLYDDVIVTVTDTVPNADLDAVEFCLAKVNGSSLTLTETGEDTDTFVGSFNLGNVSVFPNVEYSRSFCESGVGTTTDDSVEPYYAQSARAFVDVDVSDPGNVITSDYFFTDDDFVNLCFKPAIHAIDVQLLDGATLGASSTEVTLSYANAWEDPGDDELLLQMYYQPGGIGPWELITPNFFVEFDNDMVGPWSNDLVSTISSNPSEAGFVGQITTGKFTLGYEVGCGGGGGGGLVRPSLVVNALAGLGSTGAGGGSAYSSPTLQISNLVTYSQIDVPLEVEDMVYNHDSSITSPSFDLGYFENFDYPLIINDLGFVLSGFSTTIETQTLTTNTPHTIKFLYYEGTKIQHFSLYTNLRDSNTEIHQSDTQILYNDGGDIQIVDPNGFFETVDFTLNEIDDIKKEIVLEITFANPMATTDIILRSWDDYLNSFDTYILDAIEVVPEVAVESPFSSSPEPEIQELQSQIIPIWVKNNAAWWSEQQIGDSDFIAGIEYLIKNGIINVPGVEVGTSTTEIPDWIKNNAAWWSESLITDDDFVEAMQWLVAEGVIQI